MITIKAFDKNLRCLGFQYRVGEEYEIPTNEVKICERGFHASTHCDISETVRYYPDILKTRYCLVDINVVEESSDKVVGDRIKILKELDFDECIEYDKRCKWCYEYARLIKDKNKIEKLQDAVIEKDIGGVYCHWFALNVEGADIEKLQDATIEKDETGKWCYWFAKEIGGANIKKLQDAVIEKDETGHWCYWFAKYIEGADANDILQKMREKFGKSNKWYKYLKKSLEKNTL